MIVLLDLAVVCWLLVWAAFILKKLSEGQSHSVSWVILVFVSFCGLPVALDHLLGVPAYESQPGFRLASRDVQTKLIYDLYVAAVPLILWGLGRSKYATSVQLTSLSSLVLDKIRRFWPWLLLPLVAPFLLAIFSPDPAAYLQYGAVVASEFSKEQSAHHAYIALTARFSLGAAALLILITKRLSIGHILFISFWVLTTVWIHGKRSIVAMGIALFLFVFWQRGALRNYRLIVAIGLAVVVMGIFSQGYQATVRSSQTDDWRATYEDVRIDYGRDAQIKMTIFAELNPDRMKILEHRGQSALFYLTMYVPRDIWPEKPLPYAQYFTSAMFLQEPKFWGWGMTTSWLEEAIANFGWFGMLIGPALPAAMCRISDSRPSLPLQVLGTLTAILFLVVQLPGFAPILVLWGILLVRTRRHHPSKPEYSSRGWSYSSSSFSRVKPNARQSQSLDFVTSARRRQAEDTQRNSGN